MKRRKTARHLELLAIVAACALSLTGCPTVDDECSLPEGAVFSSPPIECRGGTGDRGFCNVNDHGVAYWIDLACPEGSTCIAPADPLDDAHCEYPDGTRAPEPGGACTDGDAPLCYGGHDALVCTDEVWTLDSCAQFDCVDGACQRP